MLEILDKLFNDKVVYYKDGGKVESNKEYRTTTTNFNPMTIEDANKVIPDNKYIFDTIPSYLYNKKISIGDYTIHFQYFKRDKPISITPDEATDEWKKSNGHKSIRGHHVIEEKWCVILEYHGVFNIIGSVVQEDWVEIMYLNDGYFGNWWVKASDYGGDRRIILDNCTTTLQYFSFNELILDLINKIPSDIDTDNSIIDFQHNYEWGYEKFKSLSHYHNPDYEFFIKMELKNDVYKPSKSVIEKVFPGDTYDNKYPKPKDSDLLKKLGVNTVHLRTKDHFPVDSYFNMNDIVLKAPKSIINLYDYAEYVKDEKTLETIKKDKEEKERKEKMDIYNDTFTLVFHGKEIKKNVSSYDIIKYLENKTSIDIEKSILDNIKIIFDIYKEIDKYELATFGTYYTTELAGEFHYNTDSLNNHIGDEVNDEIYNLYGDNIIIPDEDYLDHAYGRPQKGAMLIGVRRNGKGIELYTEDYDLNM